MRLLYLLPLLLLLTACRGTTLYTSEDVTQVKQGWATIHPLFKQWETAYNNNDASAMQELFPRIEKACHLADVIDNRDSIDPNTNLFQASIGLDNMCNGVEETNAYWRHAHHLSYDKVVLPARADTILPGTDHELLNWNKWLADPGAATI